MKIIFKILTTVLLTNLVVAQGVLPKCYDTTSANVSIVLNGNGFYQSSAVNDELVMPFIRGGKISEEVINSNLDNLDNANVIGAVLNSDLEVRLSTIKVKLNRTYGLSLKMGHTVVGSLGYSKDLFGFTFKGNTYQDSLNFSKAALNFQQFSKIGVGLFDVKGKSSVHLNLILGQQAINGYLRNTHYSNTLNPYGFVLKMDGEYQSNVQKKAVNGVGVGVDFDFMFPFGKEEDKFKGVFQFTGQNLGAVRYQNINAYAFDTTLNYSGFNITSLQEFNTSTTNVLDSLGVRNEKGSKWVLLPSYFQAGKVVDMLYQRKLQSFFGIRLYPSLTYKPQIYVGGHYQLKKQFSLGLQGSIGGFGGFRAGSYINYCSNKVNIGVGTEDLVGALNKKGRGASLNFRLGIKL